MLAEIYLEMGFAEKCRDMLATMQRQLIQRPGDYEYMFAQVQLAAGQYDDARKQMEAAVAMARRARTERALSTVENLVRGTPLFDVNPQQGNYAGAVFDRRDLVSDLRREAQFNFELGLMLIEMGKPKEASEAFVAALDASPRFPYWRPIVEYYCKLIPNVKLPPNPPPYLPEDELTQKFERRQKEVQPPAPKAGDPKASEKAPPTKK
jgi:tetratricopeptide (TPR) repeat protein